MKENDNNYQFCRGEFMDSLHSKPVYTNQGAIFVKLCQCGGVHLCIGGVSINLAKDTVTLLARELNSFVGKLQNLPNIQDVSSFIPSGPSCEKKIN